MKEALDGLLFLLALVLLPFGGAMLDKDLGIALLLLVFGVVSLIVLLWSIKRKVR